MCLVGKWRQRQFTIGQRFRKVDAYLTRWSCIQEQIKKTSEKDGNEKENGWIKKLMEWLIVFFFLFFVFCFRWVGFWELVAFFSFFCLRLVILLIKIHVDGPFSDHAVTTEKKQKRRESRERESYPARHSSRERGNARAYALLVTNKWTKGTAQRLCAAHPKSSCSQVFPFSLWFFLRLFLVVVVSSRWIIPLLFSACRRWTTAAAAILYRTAAEHQRPRGPDGRSPLPSW